MSKNFLSNFALFGIFFLVLYFNSVLMPSILDSKERNIEVLKSVLGINENNKISEVKFNFKFQCDFQCANDCLRVEDLTEPTFKQCLREKCSCEFVSTKTNSNSLLKFYFAICVVLSTFVAIYFYLKNNFMNFQSFVEVSESAHLKEFFLSNPEKSNNNEYKRLIDY